MPDIIRYYLNEEPLLENVETLPARRPRGPRRRHRALGPLRRQAGRRLGGQGDRHRAAGRREDAGGAARDVLANPRGFIAQRPVALSTLPDLRRRAAGAAPRRPATVRHQRRQRRVGAARRADPRGTARGRARRQFEPGRWIQGHLGARRRPEPLRGRSPASPAHRAAGRGRWPTPMSPASAGRADQRRPSNERRRAAVARRRVALLDRPLRRARRRHRSHHQRLHPPDRRRPLQRRRDAPVARSSRSWASSSTKTDRSTTDVVLERLVFAHESPSAITGSLRPRTRTPAGPRGDLLGDVGLPQRAPSTNCAARASPGSQASAPRATSSSCATAPRSSRA